jgi:gamma-glutamyl:cysteine ligase YbdK (ATP-grasp superfamily)
MDPLVAAAVVTAVGAFAAAVYARHLQGPAEEAKAEAVQTANELHGMEIQLDGWQKLYTAAVADNDRLKVTALEERARADGCSQTIERLERDLVDERRKNAEWRRIVADLEERRDDGTDG